VQTILDQIGQFFLVGFPGEEPSRPFLNFLAEEQIGGVILFEDNCPSHSAARENIQSIRARYDSTALFVAIDQEGGRICRLKGAPAEFESAWSFGTSGTVARFSEVYTRSATLLESLGFNLNLAPVCDLYLHSANPCLQDRCFGSTVEIVTPFIAEAVKVSQRCGLLSCLKHFPGLGAAVADPHEKTAEADYDFLIWQQRERMAFVAGVEAGANMVMTTHLRLPEIDSEIATVSRKIVGSMLRQELPFDGLIITDDLTMAGAVSNGHIGELAVAAFNAGHDLLLFGQDCELAMEAFDYFRDAVKHGLITREKLQASLQLITGCKSKLNSSVFG
jgi:beta-N-acetylhexosaminidase